MLGTSWNMLGTSWDRESLCITTAQQGKTKTKGSLSKITAQQSLDRDWGKPVHNHSLANARPRPGKTYVQPEPRKGNTTKMGGSLCTTTAQKKAKQRLEEACA